MSFEAQWLCDLITAIYDAALDETLWPAALEQICFFVGGPAAMIFAHDGALRSGQRFFPWGDDLDFTRLYFDRYVKINPIVLAQSLLDVGEVGTAPDLAPWEEFIETRFYREWAAPQGYVDNVFSILDKSETSFAVLAVTRDTNSGAADDEARQRLGLVAPHVRRAVLIGNVIDLRKAEAAMLAEVIAGLASAVFFVDSDGGIVFANNTGKEMLSDGSVLRPADGVLKAVDPQGRYDVEERFFSRVQRRCGGGHARHCSAVVGIAQRPLAGSCPASNLRPAGAGAGQLCRDRCGVRAAGGARHSIVHGDDRQIVWLDRE